MATVTVTSTASKKDLKQVKQYLENIDASKVEAVYGTGEYKPWHGDTKSQSGTSITFQTMTMRTTGKPPVYVTIVAKKKTTAGFIEYRSATWDSAETIIEEMIKHL